ncbi:MAG: pilus assembly protein [Polaromonas sp.]|jgi:Flp pilus assembly protein TadG|uniref:TadE/TadG family type IV pilus assembly protein n=1 Tax=Polaromonas sp. TaxID=1869339 RepID=UPI00273064BF|nr:TadE family protein [Polaromonas sp.]MDP2254495.1 pilus assembly protein [Polaromonas sp.]MDP3709183.1 pilus assembly protein [Polaromonas sp.]
MNQRQKGVALVEFALILPFLLLLSMITTEFGRAMYQYNTLTKSVRDASRYLSLQTPGTKITEARNLMVYGNTAGTGTPLALGLTTAHVPDPTWQTAGTNPVINTVTVRIQGYTFNSLFPSVFGISFGSIPFTPISATMRSYL